MALFESLRRSFRTPQVRYVYGGDAGVAVANMDAAQLYRTQPNLRAVISFLADNAAQVPLKVHDRAGDNDRPRVTDSPAALLLQHPNPDMTPFEFKRWLYSDLLLYERHLSILAPSADTESGWELRPVPAQWIQELKGRSPFAPEAVTVMVPNSQPVEIPASRFVLFHGYDPTDPMRQYSRISALKETLHEQVESNGFRRQMWHRGGRFNAYLTRPLTPEPWSDEAIARFKETWKASWAGGDAAEGGGMPILEDGMEIRTVQFNSRDAQWAEAVKLSREDCAAVYHVNPALIWPGNGQTYASAKDNARALYNDTLAPLLMQATDRVNMDVLPRVGEPASHYLVYDISIKTKGTFEERVSAGQTACGVPFLTINEVRGEFDMPAIEGGDMIVQPLNVLYGGLASTHDTDPTVERYNAAPVGYVDEHGNLYMRQKAEGEVVDAPKAPAPETRMVKGDPSDDDDDELAAVYRRFFERQAKSVLPKIEGKAAPKAGGDPPWWDAERWNRELADDLYPVAIKQADTAGERVVRELWPGDPARKYGKRQTAKYIRRTCEMRAEVVNATTLKELQAALEQEDDGKSGAPGGEKGLKSTVRGVFQYAASHRALTAGAAFAAGLAGFALHEACKQNRRRGENVYKTWRTRSGNPRSSHKALDGETVQMDEKFSNGMSWPGDWSGGAAECARCRCVLDVEVREKADGYEQRIQRRIDSAEVIGAGLYSMTAAEVAAEADAINAELARISTSTPNVWKSKDVYRSTYAKHVESKATKAAITIEDFARIEGKELQAASWLSKAGVEVQFRNANTHLTLDGNTSDAVVGGIVHDIKRVASSNPQKIMRRVSEKADRQGPGFIVDLSVSEISLDDAMRHCATLLDDSRIETITVIKDGRAMRLKK